MTYFKTLKRKYGLSTREDRRKLHLYDKLEKEDKKYFLHVVDMDNYRETYLIPQIEGNER